MKQLQNNYTTPEQSKRLLELGLPADSADMFYFAIGNSKENYDSSIFYETPDVLKCGNIFHKLTENTLPCWSAGRLIEIMLNSQIDTGTYALGIMFDKYTFSIESLIDIIDEDIKEFDFSKLEE